MNNPKSSLDPEADLHTVINPGKVTSPAAPAPSATIPPTVVPSMATPLPPVANPTGQITGAAKAAPPQATPTPSASGGSYTHLDAVRTEPEVGARLHHYEIIKMIGRGGMGSVYLARDTRLGRKVAIKFLRTQSAELTKRFILEARTTAAVSHENIVTIFEVDAWQQSPFMVFEFLQGQTLTKLIPEGKPLPAPRAVELIMPVIKALAYAHSQGVVHRDLKPDNILVCDTGVTKVLDFGIAKVLQGDENAPAIVTRPRAPKTSLEDEDDSQEELTQKGAMMGTLSFMAPEQWGIGVPIDHRADIWAVGIMLFKMLAGKHPLDPLKGHQLMVTGMLDSPMPLLSTKAADVPKELAKVVDTCLMKRKEQRWPDAVTLLRALEPFLPGRFSQELKIDESPYTGLSAFQESDANRFFGRRLEVAATVNRVRERPLIGIVGPSGAGKSSFVRAGLVPALKRSGEPWEAMVFRPGRSPIAALAALISPMVSTSVSVADDVAEQKKLASRLLTEPGYAGAVLRSRARREKKNILLFVDQFEELYTLVASAEERHAFTAALSAIADDATSPIRLVLSIRSDFLDRVPEDQRFMAELSQGLVFLGSPGTDGLREAIVQPAELAGYKFETPIIADDMIKHLASTPGALPLLQFAATKLWDARDPARKLLTQAAYEAIGGVAGALASHADQVISKLPPQTASLVRQVFLRLVTPERTRAIVGLDELNELSPNATELKSVVNDLVQARLLTVQTGGGAATVEIVHESLIHSWPMLKRWLEESGEDAAFLEQLRTASRQWQAKGQQSDLVWRGELAEEAERFKRRYRGPLGDAQQGFLEAVVELKGRQARQRRTLTVGGVTFLVLLLVASGVALVTIRGARDEAQEQATVAKAAEAEARQNQEKAEAKEKERAAAAAQAAEAAKNAEAKRAEAEKAKEDLVKALNESEAARRRAAEAESRAGKNAAAAVAARKASDDARSNAERLARQLKDNLEKEKLRVRALEEASGSPVIDTLK